MLYSIKTMRLKKLIKKIFKIFGFGVLKYSTIEKYNKFEELLGFLNKVPHSKIAKIYQLMDKSKSQIHQDLFVLSELNFKKNGFFVEFGATNGVNMSNSFLLETEFYWNGILAEPAICWHEDLKRNRKCYIDTNCVWKDSKSILKFNQVKEAEFSTIDEFTESDFNPRELNQTYEVTTISLLDLLNKYNAPEQIDYLSIDTEGSEYEILKDFDFSKYHIKIISCEHNLTAMRDKVYKLLTEKGYTRKYSDISLWDDWYILDNT